MNYVRILKTHKSSTHTIIIDSYRDERKQVDDVLSFFMNAEVPDFKYNEQHQSDPPKPKPKDPVKVNSIIILISYKHIAN